MKLTDLGPKWWFSKEMLPFQGTNQKLPLPATPCWVIMIFPTSRERWVPCDLFREDNFRECISPLGGRFQTKNSFQPRMFGVSWSNLTCAYFSSWNHHLGCKWWFPQPFFHPIVSMELVYLPTWMVQMDGEKPPRNVFLQLLSWAFQAQLTYSQMDFVQMNHSGSCVYPPGN